MNDSDFDLFAMRMYIRPYRKINLLDIYRLNVSASLNDEDGKKVSEITLHPQKTSWTDHYYSPDVRVESQVTRTGRTVRYSYKGRGVTTDDNGRTSSRQLDSWGKVLTQTDPENTLITHRYSSNGHPVSTTVGSHTITVSYDDKGSQLKLFDPDIGEMNCGPANVQSLTKGKMKQQIARAFMGGGDPDKISLIDLKGWNLIAKETGRKVRGLEVGDNLIELLNSGADISYNLNVGMDGVGHMVSLNKVVYRTIIKPNGNRIYKSLFYVMDPAVKQYTRISSRSLGNYLNRVVIQ